MRSSLARKRIKNVCTRAGTGPDLFEETGIVDDASTLSFRFFMSNNRHTRTTTDVLSLRFNQDSSMSGQAAQWQGIDSCAVSGCFICATCDGIRIFNVEPFTQKSFLGKRETNVVVTVLIELSFPDVGRVTYAEMLYRTNLIAYVPADHVTGLPSNVGRKTKYLSLGMSTTSLCSSECVR